ncbi:MAG TPA: 4-hydroxyphenylacetate 3-hydroxylase N-terminal domain-containing protein [Methylomirabilota bacterium]|jgi:4-hydroxybutyryl-CoA dehydratase/vinylacetyl-CoA-Delta-isomerase|nr:4-hydroxyphenylacetate 3-hydroxylase N-terminal domain-containing protein [Methylomirabilota bacterium]
MAFRTSAEYLAALRAQRPVVYEGGRRIEDRVAYKPFAPTLHCWGTWIYDCVKDPEVQRTLERARAVDGAPCHPFWAFPRTTEELLDNILVARQVSRVSPAAGYATIGRDELAALYVVTWSMKRDGKGEYFDRVREFVRRFQHEQRMTAAAITDPKGDRRLRPAEQPNREAYLRVVERRRDGIVVRGCKMHTSGSVAAEELIVAPTRAMRREDADYAVSFAIPVDAPGVKLVARAVHHVGDPETSPMTRKDQLLESLTIFEDVFVPWERVFMCGEWQYSGDMANIFANINRQGYLGADVGKLDIFIGAAHRIAELNGIADAPHVRDKITQLIKLQALIWSTGVAASTHARLMEPGVAVPDAVYANTGKHVAMEGHYLATRLLLEIAGGAVETLPSVEDQRAPELRPYFEKYYAGATGTAAERIRLFRFIRDLTASEYAGWWDVEIIHGSGSPAAEWLQMYREYDLDRAAKHVDGLVTDR